MYSSITTTTTTTTIIIMIMIWLSPAARATDRTMIDRDPGMKEKFILKKYSLNLYHPMIKNQKLMKRIVVHDTLNPGKLFLGVYPNLACTSKN
jgi:hypothetical protein